MRAHTDLPPALVDEITANGDAIRPLARGMAAVNLFNTFKRVQMSGTTIKERIDFQNMLNKLSGMEVRDLVATAGGAPAVVINITRARDERDTLTIQGTQIPMCVDAEVVESSPDDA